MMKRKRHWITWIITIQCSDVLASYLIRCHAKGSRTRLEWMKQVGTSIRSLLNDISASYIKKKNFKLSVGEVNDYYYKDHP